MKSANLLIGLGVGLLIGAVAGIYFSSSDEEKAEYLNEINAKVDKAKEKIGKMVNDGLDELEKASDKINHVAQNAISRVKACQI
ncbi:MAG: hypothetical protein LBB85_08415 [Dysgonamonadaceae bacterium]|jgi:gas vesicle protein|nr:hypothetical protein [Dysgonamonadaceae bacterium]